MTEMQVKERRQGVPQRKLEKSGRITPRQVLEAYEETGLLPRTGDVHDGEFACAVGALCVYRYGDAWAELDSFRSSLERQAGRGYFMGFWMGFDGIDDVGGRGRGFLTGYRDGQRARRCVFAEVKLR